MLAKITEVIAGAEETGCVVMERYRLICPHCGSPVIASHLSTIEHGHDEKSFAAMFKCRNKHPMSIVLRVQKGNSWF